MSVITASILRFKFSDDIMDIISKFAKCHQFDDRHTYKERWDIWFEENNVELSEEINILKKNGYKGDVEDKMYKAGRYYFRKKQMIGEDTDTDINKDIKIKRAYVSMNKILIEEMDKHIISSIRSHTAYGLDYTPAIGWKDFCKMYESLIYAERERLELEHDIGHDVIDDKIKKTYKNRYFIITR
jgi:hypothetical protein